METENHWSVETEPNYDPYCKNCGSCGEDGCCSDWRCTHEDGCLYPETKNGLIQKTARVIFKATKSYDITEYFYQGVQDFPYWFNKKFVCPLLGHTLPNGFGMCQRCWEFIDE